MENASQGYVETNVYGTPEQIVEKYAERRKIFGTDFIANAAFCHGGMPFEQSATSLKLFGDKVIPELHKM